MWCRLQMPPLDFILLAGLHSLAVQLVETEERMVVPLLMVHNKSDLLLIQVGLKCKWVM